jgi:hypothetical protein
MVRIRSRVAPGNLFFQNEKDISECRLDERAGKEKELGVLQLAKPAPTITNCNVRVISILMLMLTLPV